MSCCRPVVLPLAAHAALGIGPCVVLAQGRGAERRAGLQAGGSGGLVPPPAGRWRSWSSAAAHRAESRSHGGLAAVRRRPPIPRRQGSAACSWRVGTLAAGRLQLGNLGERKGQRQAPHTSQVRCLCGPCGLRISWRGKGEER